MTAKMKYTLGEKIFYLFVAALLAVVFYTLPPLGLYSNEEGVKYVQMKNFALHGSLTIPFPGEKLGLVPEALVKGGGIFSLRDGEIQTRCAPLFPYLTSLFYPIFGDRAIHFLPLLFFFLTFVVLGRTLALIMERGRSYYFLLMVYLCGSPVFLFLFGFAENTAALFLATVSLRFLVRNYRQSASALNFFCASLLMGGTVFFIPESFFIFGSFLMAGGIVLCRDRKWMDLAAFLSGALVAAAAFVISDKVLYGQFPGPYLADFFRHHPLSETRVALFAAIITLGLLIPYIVKRAGLGIPWAPAMNLLFVILLAAGVLVTVAHRAVVPFILAFPAVLFTFYGNAGWIQPLQEKRGSIELILAGTVLFCLLLASSVARPNAWTTLHACLPAVSATVLMMGLSGERIFRYPGMYGILAFTAVIVLVLGYGQVKADYWLHTDSNAKWVAFLKENTAVGDVIIFDNRGSMEHAGPLFFDRIFLVASGEAVYTLLDRLKESGVKQCHLWTRDTRLKFQLGNPYGDRKEMVSASLSTCHSCGISCSGTFSLVRVDLEKKLTLREDHRGRRVESRVKG
jgi:hypothetical protein